MLDLGGLVSGRTFSIFPLRMGKPFAAITQLGGIQHIRHMNEHAGFSFGDGGGCRQSPSARGTTQNFRLALSCTARPAAGVA